MATTSLWAVRGNIRDVVAYVKDPNKTANPDYDLQNVLSYAVDNDKTEKQYFVTGLNCSPHFAFERMSATKERYGKRGGIVAYHGYQSFKPGERKAELQTLERARKDVDNRRRRLNDPEQKARNSAERSEITRKMITVRREMNLADDILSDVQRLTKAIAAEKACEERLVPDKTRKKQKNKEQER